MYSNEYDLDFLFDRLLVFVSFRQGLPRGSGRSGLGTDRIRYCGACSWAARLKTANLNRPSSPVRPIHFLHTQCFAMQGTLSPSQWILAGYGASSGILLLCLETQLTFLKDRIADSFGFLFNPVLRFLFLLLTASVSWLHHHIFSDAVAIALIVVAVLNLYVMCRFPTLWEIQKTNR